MTRSSASSFSRAERRLLGRVAATACAHACTAVLLALCALPARAQDNPTSVATALYVRSDTDKTTIVTPRVRVGAPVAEETRIDLVYTVDVWTSASIDIRTSATKRVTEQRDEIDVSIDQGVNDALSVGGSYRYSIENDYESHGGTLGGSFDFADNNANIALVTRLSIDEVWAAGDPNYKQPASSFGARLGFTQVLDPNTFGQLIYELGLQDGYLSSPYRYVRIASDVGTVPGTCVFPVDACLPERNPGSRTRHAVAVIGRHAFSDEISVGGGYRFYFDSWDLTSHTIDVDGAWTPDAYWLFGLGYRFYTQGSASHYKPFYPAMPAPEFYTSDKELSATTSHRIALELTRAFDIDEEGSLLRLVLLAAPTFYSYSDFPQLSSITAFETTLSMELLR